MSDKALILPSAQPSNHIGKGIAESHILRLA